MVSNILVLVWEITIHHQVVVQYELAVYLVVIGKFAVSKSGGHVEPLYGKKKIPGWVIFKFPKKFHGLINTIKLNQPNRIIGVDRLNGDEGFLSINLEMHSSILRVAIGDIDHSLDEIANIVVGEELVVLLVLVVAVLVEAIVVQAQQIEVEVHSEVFFVLEYGCVLVPDQDHWGEHQQTYQDEVVALEYSWGVDDFPLPGGFFFEVVGRRGFVEDALTLLRYINHLNNNVDQIQIFLQH